MIGIANTPISLAKFSGFWVPGGQVVDPTLLETLIGWMSGVWGWTGLSTVALLAATRAVLKLSLICALVVTWHPDVIKTEQNKQELKPYISK